MIRYDIAHRLRAPAAAHEVIFEDLDGGPESGLVTFLYAGRGVGGVMDLQILEEDELGRRKRVPFRLWQRSFLVRHARYNPRTFVLAYSCVDKVFYLIGPAGDFPDQYLEEKPESSISTACLWSGENFDEKFFSLLTR